ncbi:hypothetical protein EST38_g8196 [Candolleomyces aberdarensis]|uniref:Chitin synthase export chaperone n=1 Tax=Candolleomyces aberdarensis TaxID=2316362 RepID=A0A4Q2DFE7_9AGAR|nr:hypothetical protein EST38_g8196 [Candolleomyces aberdarensis]
MESLPLDTSHPAVRDYLTLVRLQVLTPLSLLVNIATTSTCAIVVNPSLGGISRLHPTSISPRPSIIEAYVGAIFLGQLGYCLLLVMASKPETKRALVKGVGFSLVFANLVMALWAISWIMEWFLVSTILQGIILLLLFYSNVALLIYHAPVSSRPLDTALIHAPLRFFLVLPFSILFPLSLFMTLGFTYVPIPGGGPPRDYSAWHAWVGFGVILGTNIVGLLVVLFRRDIVWCASATWICVSIWSLRPKPAPVYVSVLSLFNLPLFG